MGNSFNLNFKYSEKEFRSATVQSHGNSKRIIFDLFIVAALFAYGIYLLVTDKEAFISAILIVISMLYIFAVIAKNYLVPVILFRREPKFKEEYHLSFLEDGITFTAGDMNSNIAWNFYNGITETKDFILLTYGKKRHTIIPKRIFQDKKNMEEFLDFFQTKVNKKPSV